MNESKKLPAYQWVAHRVRDDIIAGRLPGGTRLKISELSERYEASSIPVREALQTLSGEGLVVIEPNKGATIRSVDTNFLNDIFEIRKVLEGYTVRRFVELCSDDDIDELNQIQCEMEMYEDSGDMESRRDSDVQLHLTITKVVANSEIERIIHRHGRVILGVVALVGQTPHRRKQVREEHRNLIQALHARDKEQAVSTIVQHFENTRAELALLLRQREIRKTDADERAFPSRS